MNCDSKKIFFSCVKSFFICAIAKGTTLQCWYSGKHVTCIWGDRAQKRKGGKNTPAAKVTRAARHCY